MADDSTAAKRLDQEQRDREHDFAVIDRMAAAFADVPFDEIEAEAAKALAEVRAEMAAEARARVSNSATPGDSI